ncbi:MAG: hypothetical protein KJ646_02840 [Nanoarchaeota archaeon]|nr:hypothetical protein [Nanoarchaeota archaeon]
MDGFSLEKVKKKGINLNSFFNKKLLEISKELELQSINITFVKHNEEMKSKNIPPQILIASHENDKEIKEKLIHINSSDEKLLKEFLGKL